KVVRGDEAGQLLVLGGLPERLIRRELPERVALDERRDLRTVERDVLVRDLLRFVALGGADGALGSFTWDLRTPQRNVSNGGGDDDGARDDPRLVGHDGLSWVGCS